jgi:hypothetical protein
MKFHGIKESKTIVVTSSLKKAKDKTIPKMLFIIIQLFETASLSPFGNQNEEK